MKISGVFGGAASGALGNVVASHNRGGQYLRLRVVPTNPQTQPQINSRAALANVSQQWASLTSAEQLAWYTWAETNKVTDRLGKQITLQGNAAYIMINKRLYEDGDALLSDPPIAAPPAPLTSLSGTYDIGLGNFDVIFTATPLAAGVKLIVWAAVVESAGIRHIKNLLRRTEFSAAAETSPFDTEAGVTAVFGTLQVGQVVHYQVQTFDTATGHVSEVLATSGTIIST